MAFPRSQTATLLSTLLLAIGIGIFVAGRFVRPDKHHLSLSPTTHITLWPREFDTEFIVYGDDPAAPYHGSIITLGGAGGANNSPYDVEKGFNAPGIYYRHIELKGIRIRTFAISTWYLILPFAIFPTLWLVRCLIRPRKSS